MPLYEFVCEDCQTASEQLVMGSEKPTCPKCQGGRLTRQFSLPAKPVAVPAGGGCDPSLPPCNPACCRLPRGG